MLIFFSLKINDCIIENSNVIANELNNYFVNLASKIKEPIETSKFDKLRQFCNDKIPNDTFFTIPEISCEKIGEISEKY